MPGCCGPSPANSDPDRYRSVFGAAFSRSVARSYERHGLSGPARRIVRFLEGIPGGLAGATVLEVGGGAGEIQLELLARGAARTTNLELSDGYEEDAARLIARAGVAGRVDRRLGVDLADAPDDVEPADVVVLHRVVCCYPDYERLLGAAAGHARRAIVFSHPPRHPFSRAAIGGFNLLARLTGKSFRAFVHPPEAMAAVVRAQGLDPVTVHRGLAWHVVGALR
ncbi:hypothetical protein GCM10028789_06650 [Sinomonas halotolerans]